MNNIISRDIEGKMRLDPRHWVIVSPIDVNNAIDVNDMPKGTMYLSVLDDASFSFIGQTSQLPIHFKKGSLVVVKNNNISYYEESLYTRPG